MKSAAFLLSLLFVLPLRAQKFYTYLMDLGPDYVQLAWGTLNGTNTIGRSSPSHGTATIHIAGRTIASDLNYVTIGDLEPDHDYTYNISIGPMKVGSGAFRTWAANPGKLTFFVIGDFGTGNAAQYKIAQAMWNEFQRRAGTDSPVRFIISVGDNIYGNINTFIIGLSQTGASDRDWERKFFTPYEPLLAKIPFFGTLGNHDGNETESPRDLPAFLDNFAFPGGKPARWYAFDYSTVARFVGLDSTRNTESGPPRPVYLEDSAEFLWMKREFAIPHPAWIIPYFHHPPFTAGPFHPASLHDLAHWVDLFGRSGVKVVFTGHEHNFQMSEANAATHGIRFLVTGAGGELRLGSVQGRLQSGNMAMWAAQNHFLVVEIEGKTMLVTPVGFEAVHVEDVSGHAVQFPIVITIP